MQVAPPELYKRYHLDRSDERTDLFRKLVKTFGVESALYPGCFVHIAPSFVIQQVSYVEMDRRAKRFFADPETLKYVEQRKEYAAEAQIRFHATDYEREIDERPNSFDLLISQYAGFIGPVCKKYLKIGGLLVANNSHGDAGMAKLDSDFELVGVVNRKGEKFSLSDSRLDEHFVPKRDIAITPEFLRERGKGIGYTLSATGYVFRRIA